MDPASQASLAGWSQARLYFGYINIASIALFIYEYCITFGLEVDFVWFSRWTWIKVLFLVSRYLPFLSFISLYLNHVTDITANACINLFKIDAWFFVVGAGVAEIILTLRTCAIWGMERKVVIGMFIFYVLTWGLGCVTMQLFLRSLHSFSWAETGLPGCSVVGENKFLSIDWVLLLVYDSVNLVLILISGYSTFRGKNNVHAPLVVLVYRQGIFYYLFLFGISLLNVVLVFKLPPEFVALLSTAERVLHSILTSRVVLHTREQGDPDRGPALSAIRSSLHFRTTTTRSPTLVDNDTANVPECILDLPWDRLETVSHTRARQRAG